MKSRIILAIALIAAAVSHAAAADKADAFYYDARYGMKIGFGAGWLVNPDMPHVMNSVTGNLSKTSMSFDVGVFWFPARHWGVGLDFARIIGSSSRKMSVETFGLSDGYVNAPDMALANNSGFVRVIYRLAIKRFVVTAGIGVGVSGFECNDSREYLAKQNGSNITRRIISEFPENCMFAVNPRIACWLPLGHNFSFIGEIGVNVLMGSSLYFDTSLTDVYEGTVIDRWRVKLNPGAVFDVRLGIAYYFNSWKK